MSFAIISKDGITSHKSIYHIRPLFLVPFFYLALQILPVLLFCNAIHNHSRILANSTIMADPSF
jgi:hypothetical protein